MEWEVELTDEFEQWWNDLSEAEQLESILKSGYSNDTDRRSAGPIREIFNLRGIPI